MSGVPAFDHLPGQPADICLIVEGCYPHVSGGVSTWLNWLMRSLPELKFAVVSIVTAGEPRVSRYEYPANLIRFQEIILQSPPPEWRPRFARSRPASSAIADVLVSFIQTGSLDDLAALNNLVNDPKRPLALDYLIESDFGWEICLATYKQLMPHGPFIDFFWAWHALMGGLFAILKSSIPPANCYHTISTGYAGLLAARLSIEGAQRTLLTEHGIYTNERRIEILMADWMVDTLDKGLSLETGAMDLRDLWITAFESYARACYAACDKVTTLFGDNQPMQRLLGAYEKQMQIIPNGIELEKFDAIPKPAPGNRPTVALVGRVVPIKDIKTFIRAADLIRREVPDIHAIVAGPIDEDPGYYEDCRQMVAGMELEQTVSLIGMADVISLLEQTHVVVLTSLSEAQPLSILEAGAAGRPCVTTNVGACREMIEGRPGDGSAEVPDGERGGFVADILAADQIAEYVVRLFNDPELQTSCGDNLARRVREHYSSENAISQYRSLYQADDGQAGRTSASLPEGI